MSKLRTLEDWIAIYDDAIPGDFCDELIALFENPTTVKGDHKSSWLRRKELFHLDSTKFWPQLTNLIKKNYDRYRQDHPERTLNSANSLEMPYMSRYEVDPVNPNIFDWHVDAWSLPSATRQVSIIIYLNDVHEGGATTFSDVGISVTPKKGRILFFPSFFNYVHKGEAPISNTKYIIVSWIHFDGPGLAYQVHRL